MKGDNNSFNKFGQSGAVINSWTFKVNKLLK